MKYDTNDLLDIRARFEGADADEYEQTEGEALISEAHELCVRLWGLPHTERAGRMRLRAMQRYSRRVTAEYGHYEPPTEIDGDDLPF